MDFMKTLMYLPALPEQPQRMMPLFYLLSSPYHLLTLTLWQLSLLQGFGTSAMTLLHRRSICWSGTLAISRPDIHCSHTLFGSNAPRAPSFAMHRSRTLPGQLKKNVFISLFDRQLIKTALTVSSLWTSERRQVYWSFCQKPVSRIQHAQAAQIHSWSHGPSLPPLTTQWKMAYDSQKHPSLQWHFWFHTPLEDSSCYGWRLGRTASQGGISFVTDRHGPLTSRAQLPLLYWSVPVEEGSAPPRCRGLLQNWLMLSSHY